MYRTQSDESLLGRTYRVVYEFICGKENNLRPWHYQYLDTFYLRRDLKKFLAELGGSVLDVGCGRKPYKNLFGKQLTGYIGLDVGENKFADVLIKPGEAFPFSESQFDVVLCTQVLEHAENLEFTLKEIYRVVKPGGKIVATFPFLYHEHGSPYDFQRFTVNRARILFPNSDIIVLKKQGGFGSTLVILLLNWLAIVPDSHFILRILKGLMMPVWILFCAMFNLLGYALDRIDSTGYFYNNILLIVQKK